MTATDTVAVTAFWRDLGLPGLVDVHTHFMPPCSATSVMCARARSTSWWVSHST